MRDFSTRTANNLQILYCTYTYGVRVKYFLSLSNRIEIKADKGSFSLGPIRRIADGAKSVQVKRKGMESVISSSTHSYRNVYSSQGHHDVEVGGLEGKQQGLVSIRSTGGQNDEQTSSNCLH